MTQDTPVKTVHNSTYIDNVIAYNKEVQRISKAVHSKLVLGQNSLPGAQSYTTGRPAAAIGLQDKDITTSIKDLTDVRKMTKQIGIKDMLDGMYNANDSSNLDSHEYLDLANAQHRPYNTSKIIQIKLK